MTKKNRKRLMNAEIANFQAVLSHPAFQVEATHDPHLFLILRNLKRDFFSTQQANPVSTIQCHLENSIRKGAGSAKK
jgi:hypothetical protein